MLLRIVLSLMLALAVGALGFYFWEAVPQARAARPVWSDQTAQQSRARSQEQPPGTLVPQTPPKVDTGGGAPPPAFTADPASTAELGPRRISLPIAGLKPADLLDTFDQARGDGERRHEATDIMAPAGTPVVAVDDGVIRKLFDSKPGGLTIYQYDPAETYCYYYAHLERYEQGITEGMQVRRGQRIGYVGSTGNADPNAPHLHFAILQLGPGKEWWQNTTPVNPYPLLMAILSGGRRITP